MDFKKGFDEALKNIPAVSEDLLRIAWKCMKIALIILSKIEFKFLRKKPGDEKFRVSFKFQRSG